VSGSLIARGGEVVHEKVQEALKSREAVRG